MTRTVRRNAVRYSRRAGRRTMRFAMHPGRVRYPRGWLGLIMMMLYAAAAMLYLMVWLCVVTIQLTVHGITFLYRTSQQQTPAIQPVQFHALADFQRMTPTEFEHALASLCQRDGCTQVTVVGGAGDLGADVIATTPDGRRIVIQAKRYAPGNRVGSPEVQRVGGTYAVVHHAQLAAVVTTSGFTQAAVGYAGRAGIRLLGARELAGWVTRTGPAPWH